MSTTLPQWANNALKDKGISIHDIENFFVVERMISALSAMVTDDASQKTVRDLLYSQPDVKQAIERKERASNDDVVDNVDLVYYGAKPDPEVKEAKRRKISEIIISDDEKVEKLIDLTTIEHEDLIVPIVPTLSQLNTQQQMNNEVVCFGIITTQFASIQHSIFYNALRESQFLNVTLHAEPTGTPNVYALRVETTDGQKLGYVDRKMSGILSPILTYIRMDGTAKRPDSMTDKPTILLTLFGHKYIAAHLGTFLAGHKIYLGHVKGPLSVPYFNPHAHGLGGVNRAELIQYGQTAKTVDEVKNQIDAIYDSLVSAEDLPEMDPDPRLCTPLYTHQKQALHFMMKCEHPKLSGDALWKKTGSGYEHLITGEVTKSLPKFHKGGILADDMGLGKTIEVISLILKSLNESVEWANKAKSNEFADLELLDYDPALMPSKGTLIICPLSTVSNWEEQLQTHLKRGSVSVYVYHGAARCQNPRVLSKFNVVVTTYNILSMEFSKDVKTSKKAANGDKEAKIPVAAMSSILHKIRWFRIVLDEAHIIKDSNTAQSKAACALSAERKWCLTGTPIQNKLEDIHSLVHFLGVEPFTSKQAWAQYITKAMKMRAPSGGSIGSARLQTLMKSVTLRRTKFSKINGKPILSLPPRRDHVRILKLDQTEQAMYDRASAQAQKVFKGFEQEGSVLRHYVHLLELILKLRQICTHPKLCKNYEQLLKDDGTDDETWNPERAAHLLGLLKETGDDDCCHCGAIIEGESLPQVSRCGHVFCENCVRGIFSSNSSFPCPMCQTSLSKPDILSVAEEAEDSEAGDAPKASIQSSSDFKITLKVSDNVSSTKTRALIEDLDNVRAENNKRPSDPIKSIIFSQWTSMLDLLEGPLRRSSHKFVRLDGRMSRTERTMAMERLKKDPNITIMLVSLKAGGVGLNLTSASRVYIMEPYWNPAIEQQAVDRVHRLGQKKPVDTIRFIVSGSIEDSILALQKKKMELAQMTFKEDSSGDVSAGKKTKVKRGEGRKDKEALQKERLADLRMLFNL